VRRSRIFLDEPVERRERLVDAAFSLVGACKLIENEIVLGVVRIGRKKLLVHLDRAA
jgi:hypothetical protein